MDDHYWARKESPGNRRSAKLGQRSWAWTSFGELVAYRWDISHAATMPLIREPLALAKLEKSFRWASLPATWLYDCISHGEVRFFWE